MIQIFLRAPVTKWITKNQSYYSTTKRIEHNAGEKKLDQKLEEP